MNKDKDLEQILSPVSERTLRAAKQHWHDGRYDEIVKSYKQSQILKEEEYAHKSAATKEEIASIKGRLEDWQEKYKQTPGGLWGIVLKLFYTHKQNCEKLNLESKERVLKEYEGKVRALKEHIEKLDSSSVERDKAVAKVVLEDVRKSRSEAESKMWSWIKQKNGIESFGRQSAYWTDGFSSVRDSENDWSLRPYDTITFPEGYAVGITRYVDHLGSERRVIYNGYLFDVDKKKLIGDFTMPGRHDITNIKVKPDLIYFEVYYKYNVPPSNYAFDPVTGRELNPQAYVDL